MSPPIPLLDLARHAQTLQTTERGERGKAAEQAALALQISKGQFYRSLSKVLPADRKRRADAGQVGLTREEAEVISSYYEEGFKANRKRIVALETAVTILRANGRIRAETVDKNGEVKPLSNSAISRALKVYGMHPNQLRQATPHVKLKSKHPNHVWQVDGSVCVLFYLPGEGCELIDLDEAVHYKNKPENLKAIEQFRVIRYVVTDHCTNVTVWRYYPHSESAEHTCRFLAWCMAPKANPQRFPFHGRPKILMVDPGATAGGLVKRFCDRLGTELIVHQSRRPRANGSVENGQNRVECAFESGLRFAKQQFNSFDALNAAAEMFLCHYNATQVLKRHQMNRFQAWMHIKAEHLVTTGPADKLLTLATREPEERTVTGNLTVSFKSRIWNVEDVPGVLVGGKVLVHWHPFHTNTAMAITYDKDGREIHHALPDVTGNIDPYNNEWGFQKDAVPIGEKMQSKPDTLADTNRKELHKLAAGEATLEAAEKKRRKTGYTPFNGEIDPFKEAKEAVLPEYITKKGIPLDVTPPTVEHLKISLPQAMMRLVKALGRNLDFQEINWLRNRYPEGIPEDAIAQLASQWNAIGCAERSEAHQSGKPHLRPV